MSTRRAYALLAIFALAAPLPARAAAVEGLLLEKGTKRPLEGVNIFTLPEKQKAVTDAQGRFRMENLPEGPLTWVVNLAGYERLEKVDVIAPGELEAPRRLYLQRSSYQVFETTVFGKAERRDPTVRSLRAEEFLKVPGAGGDPVKAVQNLPGVNRSSGFSSQVVIQGSGPMDTRYLIEGHDVPLVFHFGGLSSVMFPESVERVDYLSAGYAAEYGNAQGGIIGLEGKEPRGDRLRGLGFVDLLNAGGLIEGPAGDQASFLIGARQSYIGWVLKAVAGKNEAFDLTVAPGYSDGTAIYDKRFASGDRFRVTGIASSDTLKFLLKKPVQAEPALRGEFNNRTSFFRIIPQWTHPLSDTLTARASVGSGRDSIHINAGANYFFVDQWALTTRGELEKSWSPAWKSSLGWEHGFYWSSVKIKLPNFSESGGVSDPFSAGRDRTARGNFDRQLLGIFLRNDWKPSETSAWTFSPNLRVDRFSNSRETIVSPRPALRWQFNESLALRASGGLYAQAPDPQYSDDTFGNSRLKAPRSVHAAGGFDKDFRGGSSNGWTLSSDIFYKRLSRQIIPSQIPSENFNNAGRGEAYGIQNQAKLRAGRWSTSLLYTLSRSQRGIRTPREYLSAYDQTHLLGLMASLDLAANWSLSTRVRYATGNPYTPVVGGVFDADSDVYLPLRGPFYSQRLSQFFQTDVRVDKKWVFEEWILSFYADLQNATNRKNPESISYSYDYSQMATVSGLPSLVILGLKGEF